MSKKKEKIYICIYYVCHFILFHLHLSNDNIVTITTASISVKVQYYESDNERDYNVEVDTAFTPINT